MDRAHAEYQKELYLTGIKALHFIASIAIYSIFWMLFRYGRLHVEGDAGFRYNYFVVAGYAVCLFFFNRTYNAYLLGYPRPEYRIVKRTFDLTMALFGLIVLSPILLITGLAIRLYDGGPAIYKQVRLTRDGREFKIWNLRSMQTLVN